MSERAPLRMTCVTAHPDDESLGFGGTLARYASEGVKVGLVVGTRGERGRFGDGSEPHPGPEAMARIREAELRAAAGVLGVARVDFLDYVDGSLDQADPVEAAERVAAHLRSFRPDVVLTFDPYGAYGHPDHIAIAQYATAGILLAAAGPGRSGAGGSGPGSPVQEDATRAHRVLKLYYVAWTARVWDHYQRAFKALRTTVDGVERSAVAWPEWAVTSRADAHDHWETVWAAVQCHRTQMAQYGPLGALTPEDHRALWGPQEYYRVFSLVNGGRALERDLFEGLR